MIKNFVKRLYARRWGEVLGYALARGRPPESLVAKCLPENYLYKPGSLPRVVRHGVIFELDLADFVDWYIYFGLSDPSLEAYFREIHDDSYIIDVGANMGYTLLRAARLAPAGKVIGFEPSANNFSRCQRNLSLNNFSTIEVFNSALGRSPGSSRLEIAMESNMGMNRVGKTNQGEMISLTALDLWVREYQPARIDFIKVDVEGFEMEVLEGAEATLEKFRPRLFLEMNDTYLRRYGSSANGLVSWLEARGYSVFDTARQPIRNKPNWENHHQDIWGIPGSP